MKMNFLNTLLVEKDEDLRKNSLFPFNTPDKSDGPRFTRFIRTKYSQIQSPSLNDNVYDSSQRPKGINFNVPSYTVKKELSFSKVLQRYKDNSLLSKPGIKQNKERVVEFWSGCLSFFLMENGEELIFKKASTSLLVWNIITMLCFLFNVFEIPIAIFFTSAVYDDEFNTTAGLILNWFTIVIILINTFFVRPNTEFEKMGYLIYRRRDIIDNYMGVSFALDALGVLILIIYAASYNSQLIFLKLFFHIQTGTIFALDDMIQSRLELQLIRYAVYRLIKLLLFMLFILTWLSSIFFFIDYQFYINDTYPYTENWLTYSVCTFSVDYAAQTTNGTDLIKTYPEMWYVWLNYGIYWSLQTISTVGYGDITPRNPPSVIFTNISILILMFFFVFFINTIIEIIDETTSAQKKQKRAKIKKFQYYDMSARRKAEEISLKYGYDLETRSVNRYFMDTTANKIRSYLFEMDINNLLHEEENAEQLVNKNLTPELREELFINYRQLFFKKVLLFGEVAKITPNFMEVYEQLIYKVKEVSYGSWEVIYAHRQDQSNCLYYLLKGSLLLRYPNSKYAKLVTYDPNYKSKMETGAHIQNDFYNFGVREFFTRQPRDHSAITETYCKVQTLQYQDFITTIRAYPDFYRKYCEVRDLLLIEKLTALTGEQCFECLSKKHHLLSCQRCLFNMNLQIWRDVNVSERKRERELGRSFDCHRQAYFMRDCIRSQKLTRGNGIGLPTIQDEQIRNYKEYFHSGNIGSQFFR